MDSFGDLNELDVPTISAAPAAPPVDKGPVTAVPEHAPTFPEPVGTQVGKREAARVKPPRVRKRSHARKADSTHEHDNGDTERLRKRVRTSYITHERRPDAKELTKIDKMSKRALGARLVELELATDKAQQRAVSEAVLTVYAMVLDKLSRGDGDVREALERDEQLRQSIERELGAVWTLFNNKVKIVLLSITDVATAKMDTKDKDE